MAPFIFTAFGLCTLVPYLFFRCKKKLMPGIILKITTSVFFILTTASAAMGRGESEFIGANKYLIFSILLGQVIGLLGDYWLDMKDMYPQHHDVYVFAGFISFFIGHCFFIAGLFATYGLGWRDLLIMLGAGAALTTFVMLTEKPMKLKYGKFKFITAAYGVLFGMVIAAAFLAYLKTKQTQALVMNIGLVVFLLSDLFLSGTFFGEGKDKPFDYIANYVCYFGAQFTIALSLTTLA